MPPRVNRKANGASTSLHRADGWARRTSAQLGSVLLDTLGLAATIEWHVRRFQKRTGVPYELTVSDVAGFDLPEDCAATVFEIYNEALSNVAHHAGASRVAVVLAITPQEVTMVVRDNGRCEVAGARNAGATVTVSLPVAPLP